MINGLSFSDAQAQGLVHDYDADNSSVVYGDSLFVNGDSEDEKKAQRSRTASPLPETSTHTNGITQLNGAANPFSFTSNSSVSTSKPNPFKSTASAQSQPNSIFTFDSGSPTVPQAPNSFASKETPKFNFFPSPNQSKPATTPVPNPFGSKEAPKFSSSPTSDTKIIEQPKSNVVRPINSEQKPVAPAIFGALSKETIANAPSIPKTNSNDKPQAPTASMFSFGASSPFSPKPTIPEPPPAPASKSTQNQGKAEVQGLARDTKPGLKPSEMKMPGFSFATSPLFQSLANETQNESRSSLSQSSTFTQPSLSSQDLSTPNLPNPASSLLGAPCTTSTFQSTADVFSISPNPSSTPPPKAPTPKVPSTHNFQMPNATSSFKPILSQETPHPTGTSITSQSSFFPSSPAFKPRQAYSVTSDLPSTLSATSVSAYPSSKLSSKPAGLKAPSDPLPPALDKVTDGLMFDEGGLLQQYIEISIMPIMKSAIAHFEDEESWRAASQWSSLHNVYYPSCANIC